MGNTINTDNISPSQNCRSTVQTEFDELVSDHENNAEEDLILSTGASNIIIVFLAIFYMTVIFLIIKYRNRQAISLKSPKLVGLGGFFLLLDSIVNVTINTNYSFFQDTKTESYFICIISIVTTVLFHYISYFAIIFRAQRIINVVNLEKRYLD